jgi:low temperature requirement protein LtrA
MTWSDLIRPPQLQHSETDAGKQRTATWLELFFDLAFVLVVGEFAVGLRNDLTLHGVLVFAGLFTSVWWAWAGFTFYANRFDTDDVTLPRTPLMTHRRASCRACAPSTVLARFSCSTRPLGGA